MSDPALHNRGLPEPLPDPLAIRPPVGPPRHVTIRPPGSKSLTNRALLLAALADGASTLRGALVDADDAGRMIEALRRLGAGIDLSGETIRVRGVGGRWPVAEPVRLDLNNAGTATRFLSAAALLARVPITIDGNARMRERPIGELVDMLRQLGARADHHGAAGCPPVTITPPVTLTPPAKPPAGAVLDVPTTLSSQFVSALLLVGPWLPGGIEMRLHGEVTSAPYVRMTLDVLRRVGARVEHEADLSRVRVEGGSGEGLGGFELEIEPDASGATFFWAAGMLLPGWEIAVEGLRPDSSQGDARLPELLARMGGRVERQGGSTIVRGPARIAPIDADLADMPDAAMALAVVASFADGPSTIGGLRTLRVKETDRIAALRTELGRLGVRVDEGPGEGVITITPPPGGVSAASAADVAFDTYNDHRMAMSLALVGLRREGVCIRDPGCVGKTYPSYWRDLARIGCVGEPPSPGLGA